MGKDAVKVVYFANFIRDTGRYVFLMNAHIFSSSHTKSLEVTNLSAVIGPKGAHVADLRKKAGVEIIMPPKDAGSKVVTVIGEPSKVEVRTSRINTHICFLR